MKFYSRSEKKPTQPAPAGCSIYDEFTETIDENGHKKLEKTGQTDMYELIQKAMPETLIYNIINKYVNGDESALNKIEGIYADISEAPTSLIEAHQKITAIENEFKNLPNEIKKLFNFSSDEYIAEMSTEKGIEKIQQKITEEQKIKETQKITETQKKELKNEQE